MFNRGDTAEAMTSQSVASRSSLSTGRLGPVNMPSVAMSV